MKSLVNPSSICGHYCIPFASHASTSTSSSCPRGIKLHYKQSPPLVLISTGSGIPRRFAKAANLTKSTTTTLVKTRSSSSQDEEEEDDYASPSDSVNSTHLAGSLVDFQTQVVNPPENANTSQSVATQALPWGALALLTVIYLQQSWTQFSLPIMLPAITADLHLTDVQGGLLTTGYT